MPVGGLLIGVGGGEHSRLANGLPTSCMPTGSPSQKPAGSAITGVRDSTHTEIVGVRRAVDLERVAVGDPAAPVSAARRRQQQVATVERLEHAAAPGALALASPGVLRAGDRRAAAQPRHARRDRTPPGYCASRSR